MKVFKKVVWGELTQEQKDSVGIDEAFICLNPEKVERGLFLVYSKINDDRLGIIWQYRGSFNSLKSATNYAMFYEGLVSKYEYFCQIHREELDEGSTDSSNPSLEAMGSLGWELCAIDSRNSMFIYKRILV